MTKDEALFEFLIRLGDNGLVLAQRLGEWCGHAHQLESDIALTNVALDNLGQARMALSEAGKVEGKGRTEDDLAFHRTEMEYRNNLLLEQENGDFAQTITRQFLFDVFQYELLMGLKSSSSEFLQSFAVKSLKEVSYHRSLSSDWMVRLGDGTDLSHEKMQDALNLLWQYTGELFEKTEADKVLIEAGLAPDLEKLKGNWENIVEEVLKKATLEIPDTKGFMATGSRRGEHTEFLGYILAEMQYLPRTMPEAKW
ncbi:MAG TPA: 1,2-phenylacetyl-CoA epoxidase subunit PaaC [Cryomorphaceae bacterium]|nr:1,2-phenylacetyl-CoA epoxidase subunit PaaC [Cryomorphaceae bacterium]